ncbi:hypothetical protein V1512DRAFT_248696 [Lipomyces arxii]|uniref:uncharacterized protein n=1 Tax=Lipomyces arxii TaxID=56418 RepID=UPI0034CEFE2E
METNAAIVASGKDAYLVYDALDPVVARDVFNELVASDAWVEMEHHGGTVPRLVQVQAKRDNDGWMPLYRHPQDRFIEPVQFSSLITRVAQVASTIVGHELNHVLIQQYRSGRDYISEHADKTIDLIPNTSIVNVSIGDVRELIFREKERSPSRLKQTFELPHNSMLVMGLDTNATYLHGIKRRPDKGIRVSLTFRACGTFINGAHTLIYGLGSSAKLKHSPRTIATSIFS